ncbi:hypothetical protein SK128_027890 [Halocaridina rubra]|uniref:MIF4G domain-containing protein n=1 Tax=Halocaridina rubra TaxID=373956 RepID=A0AAN8X3F4_HALRR
MPEIPHIKMGDARNTPPVLHRCDNPWKPNAQHGHTEQIYRRMLGILNRVTLQSLSVLLEQTCELPLDDAAYLDQFLDLLLFKAQDEPIFVEVYARLCQSLCDRLGIQDELAKACETHFVESYRILMEYNKDFEGPVSTYTIYEEILVRQRFVGHLRFVSELLKVGVISSNQVSTMVETFLPHSDERSLECLCRLLSFVGLELIPTHGELLEQSCSHIEIHLDSGTLSFRLRFLIQDILALHANGWRPLVEHHRPPPVRDVRG